MGFIQIAQFIMGIIPLISGSVTAVEGLIQTIQGVGTLTAEEQASLVQLTRLAVKHQADIVAGAPVWRPTTPQ